MTPGPINTAQLCGMRQACDRQMTRLRTLWLHAHDIFTHNMPKYRTFSLPIKVFHAPIIEELLLYSTTKWVSLSPLLKKVSSPLYWGNIVYLFSLTYRCNIIAIVDLISAIAKFFPIQFLKHQFEMRFISEKGWCSEIRKLWFLHQKCDNTCVLLKSEELFLKLVSRSVL